MVTTVSASVRHSTAGLMATLAAGLLMTAAGANAAAAFGLGSIADVSKGMQSPQPQARDPELAPARGAQDGVNRPSVGAASESPAPTQAATSEAAPAAGPVEVAKTSPAPAASDAEATADSAGTPSAGSAPLPAPTPDYYAERAKEVLAAEKKGQIKLHPVQTAAPDYDILLCEAGCGAPGLQILSKRLKTEAISAGDPGSKLKSVSLNQGLECLGGCGYGNELDSTGRAAAPRDPGAEAGEWMTTAKPAPKPQAEKIPKIKSVPAPAAGSAVEKPEAMVAPPAAPAPARTAAKSTSPEDWMARINKERAAKKGTHDRAQGDGIGPVAPLKVETQ